jgi:hypothetical protein
MNSPALLASSSVNPMLFRTRALSGDRIHLEVIEKLLLDAIARVNWLDLAVSLAMSAMRFP